MKIAVVQLMLRPAPAQDVEALVLAAGRAAAAGAELIVLPDAAAVSDGPLRDELVRRLDDEVTAVSLVAGTDAEADHPDIGRVLVLAGDRCMDPVVLGSLLADAPGALILAPGSESELQAEAMLELAIGLSTSVAPLVVIAETDGADAGVGGHGGSAIVHLGEVLAEAMAGDDVLYAEILTPLGGPQPRGPLPQVPPLLAGRLASHEGRRLDVGYPADLG